MLTHLRIGTRASKLARAQAQMVVEALQAIAPELTLEIVAMTTAGDRDLHKQLSDWGYKGLFTKELEDALLERRIDLAVHSMKDMPSALPDGLTIAAMLPRADPRDAWISPLYATLDAVPTGALIGTSSARRAAQLRHRRADLRITELRGNVETRLRKLSEGVVEATLLAVAGLERLGLGDRITQTISPEIMLPAVAQGAVGIECREDNAALMALLARINHTPTMLCLTAERAFLHVLDGSCRTPIAGLATWDAASDQLHLRGEVLSTNGSQCYTGEERGTKADAEAMGIALGRDLRARANEVLRSHG